MRRLALTLCVGIAALALTGPAAGISTTVSLQPGADVGLPFACDWGYDWEERCYLDNGSRLPIGGVDDKIWRAALRFSLASVPARATVTSAELLLYHDGTCVAPRRTSVPCRPPGAVVDVHRLFTSWVGEREPEVDQRVLWTAVVFESSVPQWLTWDVTSLVRSWHRGLVPNDGLLLKLQDGDEDYGVSGPYGPSASYPDAALRPRLVVTYSL